MDRRYAREHFLAFNGALDSFILTHHILFWALSTDGVGILGHEEGRAGSVVCVYVFKTPVGCINLSEQCHIIY